LDAPVFAAFEPFVEGLELLAEGFERFGGSFTALDARFAFRAIESPSDRFTRHPGNFEERKIPPTMSSSGIYLIHDYYII